MPRITSLPWKHPTMFAPLEGVSHAAMRALIAEKGGVGIVCTEFVRIYGAKPLSTAQVRREVVKAPGVPLSVQVMGNAPEHMAEAAGLVAAAGADVVDINMGCPVPKVVKKGVGAAMLKDKVLLAEVVAAMREAVPGLLSAKIRAGFDTNDAVGIAQAIQEAGADFIVVHPRRRRDFFEGVPDWGVIRDIKENVDMPVVGNGDVWYATDVQRMRDETGCDAVMIGRPALRNPWIFQQAAALAAGEEPIHPDGDQVLAHFEDVVRRYEAFFTKQQRSILGKMKELTKYVGRAVNDDRHFMRTALRTQSLEAWFEVVRGTLRGLPADALDLDAYGVLGLEHSGRCLPR